MDNTPTTTTWREALTNENHELYEAAWLLFSERITIDLTAKQLEDKKEQVVPFLEELLQDDYLYEMSAPGNGNVHERVIRLFGKWEMRDKLPLVLDVLIESELGEDLYDVSIQTLTNFGEPAIDELLAWVEENPEYEVEIAEIISGMEGAEERRMKAVREWVTAELDDEDLEMMLDFLTKIDLQKSLPVIEEIMKDEGFSEEQKGVFKEYLKDLRKRIKDSKDKKK